LPTPDPSKISSFSAHPKELEQNEDMKQYFEDYDVVYPLEPQHAFYGGRANATNFHECKEDEKIRYVVSAPH
jgi:hypothetical protein